MLEHGLERLWAIRNTRTSGARTRVSRPPSRRCLPKRPPCGAESGKLPDVKDMRFGVALVSIFWLLPSHALAGEADAPAGSQAPNAASSVVVVADAFEDETENAKLRARIFELARGRGLTPDGKADTRAAAEQQNAMVEGKISADAAPLDGVRKSLHAGVLIRVSKDAGGLRVLVVRDGDAKSKVVADAEAVLAALGELLGGTSKGAAAPAAESRPESSAAGASQGVSAGYILKPSKRDDEPDYGDPKVLSAAWAKRGGARASYGAHAQVTGLMIPKTQYVGTNPETGLTEIGSTTTYGVGAGLGLDLSLMVLPLPEPASGSTSWAAFRVGARLDVSGLYVRPPKGRSFKLENGRVVGRDTQYDNVAYVYGVLPLELGVHFGFGDFRLPTLWRGIAFGVAYAPAFIFSLKVGEKEDATDSKFNYGGFELSVDITKLEAGQGSEPQVRLSALVLPRVNDELPWLTSLGVGAIWY